MSRRLNFKFSLLFNFLFAFTSHPQFTLLPVAINSFLLFSAPTSPPSFLFRKGQAFHGCQPALVYQIVVRLDTSSPTKAGQDNTVGGKGPQSRQQSQR